MSAWKQIREALAYAGYDDPQSVMGTAAAELYTHAVDVIRQEISDSPRSTPDHQAILDARTDRVCRVLGNLAHQATHHRTELPRG